VPAEIWSRLFCNAHHHRSLRQQLAAEIFTRLSKPQQS
jgi:hypothetical protein